jgi:hypothetical protein
MKYIISLFLLVIISITGCTPSDLTEKATEISETTASKIESAVTTATEKNSTELPSKLDFPTGAIVLDGGFYAIDKGENGNAELYLFDVNGELVVDFWFDEIEEFVLDTDLPIGRNFAYRNGYKYRFKIRDEMIVFEDVKVVGNYYSYEYDIYIHIRNNDLFIEEERLSLAERAVEFIVGLDLDFDGTVEQIRFRPSNLRASSNVTEDLEWLNTWFNGETLNSINQVQIMAFGDSDIIPVIVYKNFSGTATDVVSSMCIELIRESEEWVVNNAYSFIGW